MTKKEIKNRLPGDLFLQKVLGTEAGLTVRLLCLGSGFHSSVEAPGAKALGEPACQLRLVWR